MKVRKAQETDLTKVVELGKHFYEETRHAEVTAYDGDQVKVLLSSMLTAPGASVFVAETESGEVVGITGGLLFPLWMSPEHITGQEMFWYVQPEHRKSRAGKLLFEALEGWAKEAGAKSFSMIALSHLHENRIGQMYESKGYVPLEKSYIKVL